MANCIEVAGLNDLLQIKLVKKHTKEATKDSGKKPYKFDTHAITSRMYFDLLTGKKDKDDAPAFKRIKDVIKNNNVMRKLIGSIGLHLKDNPLIDDLVKDNMTPEQKNAAGERMQIRGIAMKHIMGAMKSEADVQKNLKISDENAEKLFTKGSRNVSTAGMATAMGRDIAFAMGFRIEGDGYYTNKVYADIGRAAMKEVQDNTGLITVDDGGFILNNKYMKNPTEQYQRGSIIKDQEVVRLNLDKFVKDKIPPQFKTKDDVIDSMSYMLDEGKSIELENQYGHGYLDLLASVDSTQKYVGRMSIPTNLMLPDSTAVAKPRTKGINMTGLTEDTLSEMQSRETVVQPKLAKLFLGMNKRVKELMDLEGAESSSADFHSILASEFGLSTRDDVDILNEIFGERDKEASADDMEKAVGQSLSKTNSLQTMIEMADQFFEEDGTPKPLFYTHEMYRTGRVGFMETMLNGQVDKFFSRFATTGGSIQLKNSGKQYNHLLRGIEDDAGFDGDVNAIDRITGKENDPVFELLLRKYDKAFIDTDGRSDKATYNLQKDFLRILAVGKINKKDSSGNLTPESVPKMGGSVWQKLSVLNGISDVRRSKDGVINTTFVTKPDATGSGIVLQLLQMMGLNNMEGAKDKLGLLGLLKEGKGKYKDVYSFLEERMKEDTVNSEDLSDADAVANGIINDMHEYGFFKTMRDIVKPTTMITSYLAGDNTVVSQSAIEYADRIFADLKKDKAPVKHSTKKDMDSLEFVKGLIKDSDLKFYKNHIEGKNLTGLQLYKLEGARKRVEKRLADTAGVYSKELIGEVLISGSMEKFHSKIKNIYSSMENIFKANPGLELRVLPAQVVLDMASNPEHKDFKGKTHKQLLDKFGMTIMSMNQVLSEDGKTVVMQNTMNQLTSLVSVIHSMDSAIMFNSHRETMKRIDERLREIEAKPTKTADETFEFKQLIQTRKMASISIHDASNGNPVYNTIFEGVYREQVEYAVQNYDMFDQMVKSYEVLVNTPGNTEGLGAKALEAMKTEAKNSLESKKDFKLAYDSDKIFGFKDLDADKPTIKGNGADGSKVMENLKKKSQKAEKTVETKPEPEAKAYKEYQDLKSQYEALVKENKQNQEASGREGPSSKEFQEEKELLDKATNRLEHYNLLVEKNKKPEATKKPSDYNGEFGFIGKDGELHIEGAADEKLYVDFYNKLVNEQIDAEDRADGTVVETAAEQKTRLQNYNDRVRAGIKHWRKESDIIDNFLNASVAAGKGLKGIITPDSEFAYNLLDDVISVPNIDALDTAWGVFAMEHEIGHRDAMSFMGANKDNANVKLINEAAKNLPHYGEALLASVPKDGFLYDRINNMLEHPDAVTNAAEMVAVLGSEKQVQQRFIKEMNKINARGGPNANAIVMAAKRIVKLAKDFMIKHGMINPDELVSAITSVLQAGADMNTNNPDEAAKGRKEFFKEQLIQEGKLTKDGYLTDEDGNKTTDTFEMLFASLASAAVYHLAAKKGKKDYENSDARKKFDEQMTYKKYEPAKETDETGAMAILAAPASMLAKGLEKSNNLLSNKAKQMDTYAGSLIGNLANNSKSTSFIGKGFEASDRFLSENLPVYAQHREGVVNYWDSDPFVAAMKGYIFPERVGDRVTMQQLLAADYEAKAARGTMTSTMIAEMKDMMEGLSKDETQGIYSVVAQAPMFHLINENNEYRDLINGTKNVKDLIKKYEEDLSPNERTKIKHMADMLVGENYTPEYGDDYNIKTAISTNSSQESARRLLALYSIQMVPNFESTLSLLDSKPELAIRLMDASLGLKTAHNELFANSKDNERYRENLVDDVFTKVYDHKAVNENEFNAGKYSTEDGWMVLRKPGNKTYGIMYRPISDQTFQEGAGTTVDHRNADILVGKDSQKKNMRGFLTTDIGINKVDERQKLVLTNVEKKKLGLVAHPADALYRSYARVHEIKATQKSRDLLITKEFTKKINTQAELKAFDKELGEMDIEDVKWMIKLPDGKSGEKVSVADIVTKNSDGKFLFPNVAKHYMKVERASSVNGFNTNVDMVRKDVSPWLMGYKDPVIFENNPKLRKVAYVVRQLVKMAKIKMVIVNPSKIAADAISNSLLLLGYDVPLGKIGSYGKDIAAGVTELETLRVDHIKAKIHGNKTKEALLKKKIDAHPQMLMVKNGLMQSINIELMIRDQSVVSGLEQEITDLIHNVTRNADGDTKNGFGQLLDKAVENGIGLDGILKFASEKTENVKYLQKISKQLGKSAKDINKRSKEDEAVWIKETFGFTGIPGSQAVGLGSYLVQMSDIIPRGILLQHLMDTGVSEADAIATVTDAFIDYKQNMPKELKVISDYGLLMFPSFWMRIQRVILHLAKEKPATAMAGMTLEAMLDLNVPSILDANLVSKLTGEYGIVGAPPILDAFYMG